MSSVDPRTLRIQDFSYSLPQEKIAIYPLPERDQCKLLVYKATQIEDHVFSELPTLLPTNAHLVVNNTRVIHARLHFQKDSGAQIEIFCLEPIQPSDAQLSLGSTKTCTWKCLVGNLKRWKTGPLMRSLIINGSTVNLSATLETASGESNQIRFDWDNESFSFGELLENFGELPIPPYLNRVAEESDEENYQTVYSSVNGSVAAPTAGLHLSQPLLQKLSQQHVSLHEVTLHVGAGTFKPVKSDEMGDHDMHREYIEVGRQTLEDLRKAYLDDEPIIGVGTTSARTLETLYIWAQHVKEDENIREFSASQWDGYQQKIQLKPVQAIEILLQWLDQHKMQQVSGYTSILIAPGYQFQMMKGLITNFHQPESTLLLMIAAFCGENWKKIYAHALNHSYRFLSFGDGSLLLP